MATVFLCSMNTRNNRKELEDIDQTERPIPEVTMEKARKQLQKMANNKQQAIIEATQLIEQPEMGRMTATLVKAQKKQYQKFGNTAQ